MEIKSFRDLKVWQLAMDLAALTYEATVYFPKHEQYGLTSQIRRSATSVAFNIAEGSSRRSTPEFMRFINIASGSLAEFQCQLLLARRLDLLNEEELKSLYEISESISRMLNALHQKLSQRNSTKTPILQDS